MPPAGRCWGTSLTLTLTLRDAPRGQVWGYERDVMLQWLDGCWGVFLEEVDALKRAVAVKVGMERGQCVGRGQCVELRKFPLSICMLPEARAIPGLESCCACRASTPPRSLLRRTGALTRWPSSSWRLIARFWECWPRTGRLSSPRCDSPCTHRLHACIHHHRLIHPSASMLNYLQVTTA
jgi:hypothetical protein